MHANVDISTTEAGSSYALAETRRADVAVRCLVAATFAGLAALLAFAAITWPWNHDEHQFIVPAIRIWHGELPYRDFSHLHTPIQAFIYAAALPLHDNPLLVARLINAFAALATLALVYHWARRRLDHLIGRDVARLLALVWVLLLAFVEVVPYTVSRSWNHSLSGLAAVAAFMLLVEGTRRDRHACLLFAGLCAGLAVGMRLSWAPLLGGLGVGLLMLNVHGFDWRRWLPRIAAFTAGLALAMMPVAYLAVQAPETFYFNIVGYHRLSHVYHLELGNWTGMPARLRALAGMPFEQPGMVLHLLLLAALVTVAVAGRGRWQAALSTRAWALPIFTLAVLFFAAAGAYSPSRVNPQYHYGMLLFTVLAASTWLALIVPDTFTARRAATMLLPAAMATALLGVPHYVAMFRVLPTGNWPHVRAEQVRDALAMHLPEGGLVLTVAPLFVEMAGLRTEPAMADGPFTFRVAHLLDDDARQRLNVIGPMDLDARFADDMPAAVLTGFERDDTDAPLAAWAERHGYERIDLRDTFNQPHVLWRR
ncbi:MAG: hypothetical protein WD118_01180 [Phycisphaeraceae bacterium]